jgi:hypothetical protein
MQFARAVREPNVSPAVPCGVTAIEGFCTIPAKEPGPMVLMLLIIPFGAPMATIRI